uniref:Uncharacterized protein n=1 Tax=Trichuris muris TaxID=70415 RepID=A0A5S6R1M4_TRIMR
MAKRTSSESALAMENLEKLHHNRAKLLTVLQRLYDYSRTQEQRQMSSAAELRAHQRGSERKRSCTVPEPFKMTIRDETAPIQALYAKRFTNELLEDHKRQEAAHRAKAHFKAGTVPPSTFLPIYQQMEICRQDRRQFTTAHSREILASVVKPFKLTEPSAPTLHKRRCRSAPPCRNPGFSHAISFPNMQEIVQPRPHSGPNLDKGARRSEQLLRLSKSPIDPKLRMREALNTRKTALRHRRICASPPLNFQPTIHRQIPDFDLLQRNFQRKLNARKLKNSQVVTVRPFNLRTSMSRSAAGSEHATTHHKTDQTPPKLTRSRSAPNFENYPPVDLTKMYNKTTRLRIQSNQQRRKDLESKAPGHTNDEHDAMVAELKEQIQRLVAEERIKHSLAQLEKRKQHKVDTAALKKWYTEKLANLRKRVFSGPTLLERQKILIAEQSLESRFKQILQEAGLDQNLFLSSTVLESEGSCDGSTRSRSHSVEQSPE